MPPIDANPQVDSLVLYKIRPARVVSVDEKIAIELEGGQTKRVRPKDIQLLHPGPLRSLSDLVTREGELDEAWALLEGGDTHLRELAELIYDEYSPATAWAAWQLVAEGLYFEGTPAEIHARSAEEVERDKAAREAKAAADRDWRDFLGRMRQARLIAADGDRLEEVRLLALGRSDHSRILQALGHPETRENAHRLLVKVGFWEPDHNPYPERFGVALEEPDVAVPDLPEEQRRDLTHLPAFAIDDEGNRDPDDAISLDGERIWVHVADVAAVAVPDGELDAEARVRGANLYIPEKVVNMLPEAVTQRLGLGLQEVSPALSFGFRYPGEGAVEDIEILASWVRVQRLSYDEADLRLSEEPFRTLFELTEKFRRRRHAQDAASIELPEVSIKVEDGEVRIRQLPRLRSRDLVTDAMLMAGEAAAIFCREREIPIPYATQPAPDSPQTPTTLADMFAYRKQFKPSRLTSEPAPHFGLGLPLYTRATSPLRRYSDLLVHQQLRAYLAGGAPLDREQIVERMGVAETAGLAVRRSERLSNQHWKLVYLRQNPGWKGQGVVVDKDNHRAIVMIPELALESKVRLRGEPHLNAQVRLSPREIDLPDLTCYFRVRE